MGKRRQLPVREMPSVQTALSRGARLCGTDAIDPVTRTLSAGALSVDFQAGALRYVRIGGIEVLRGIAFLVRDENWGTLSPIIDDFQIDQTADRFSIAYRATCADQSRKLEYRATITGSANGTLTFTALATPLTDVLTNRVGFVVLHPAGLAGKTVSLIHTDGRRESAHFPIVIDPVQPFLDIREIAHDVTPGLRAICRMEPDAFEMEDQRNWSDASYKTYVRPLSLPWPYTLKQGEAFTQSVRLSFGGPLPAVSALKPTTLSVQIGGESGAVMPQVGIGIPAEEAQRSLARRDLAAAMRPCLLICAMDARQPGSLKVLAGTYRKLAEASGAQVVLEIVIPGGDDPASEFDPVRRAADAARLAPYAIIVSPAPDLISVFPGTDGPPVAPAADIYAAARKAFPNARLGGGMLSYFTELNRKRPPAELLDFVSHTTCPIVHAADDRSVMETLETLPHIIRSTRSFIGDTPYWIGPSSIGCRQNPYSDSPTPNPDEQRLCLATIDPRQRGLFNAAWTLGYIAACAREGLGAVSMGALTGSMGVTGDGAGGSPKVHPVFHIIAGLAQSSGQPLLQTTLSSAGTIEALAYREESKIVLWLANLTSDTQTVRVAGRDCENAAIIDADSFECAVSNWNALSALDHPHTADTISLDAYAVTRLVARA